MGRMPTKFADQTIKFRIPFTMPGEAVVLNQTTGQLFPDSTYLHNVDKPFEIHRVVIEIAPMDDAATPLLLTPPFFGAIIDHAKILRNYVRLRMQDTSKNEFMTKAAQLVSTLTRENTAAWEWEEPYTIVRAEGFTNQVDNICEDYTVIVGQEEVTVANLKIAITYEGFLIVIAPPSETR